MIFYPAIDLKGGACVRLLHGDMRTAKSYNDDPADQAQRFAAAGCTWLHVVDLDGAVRGQAVNESAVRAILAAAPARVQLGGGMRNLDDVARWLEAGVTRCVLGTLALRQPELVKQACRQWPGRIVVGIDARAGLVAVEGWAKTSTVKALDLALRFEDAGAAAIVYTDIGRDGAMVGPNLEATVDLAFHLTTPLIASGGVSSLDDLQALKAHETAGIAGVICGRALYDGAVDLKAALKLVQG